MNQINVLSIDSIEVLLGDAKVLHSEPICKIDNFFQVRLHTVEADMGAIILADSEVSIVSRDGHHIIERQDGKHAVMLYDNEVDCSVHLWGFLAFEENSTDRIVLVNHKGTIKMNQAEYNSIDHDGDVMPYLRYMELDELRLWLNDIAEPNHDEHDPMYYHLEQIGRDLGCRG